MSDYKVNLLSKEIQKNYPLLKIGLMKWSFFNNYYIYLTFLVLTIFDPFTLSAQKQDNVFSDSATIDV